MRRKEELAAVTELHGTPPGEREELPAKREEVVLHIHVPNGVERLWRSHLVRIRTQRLRDMDQSLIDIQIGAEQRERLAEIARRHLPDVVLGNV